MKFRFLGLALLLSACAQAQDTAHYPPPVQALLKQGLTIRSSLPAPAGYHGYLGSFGGRPVPVYVPPDGKFALVGTLFDSNGNDLTQAPVAAAGTPPLDAGTWDKLEKSSWVAEGSKHPKRIVYVFTDTECPYCHKLWQAIQPLLAKGDVQVRNVMVAVIGPNSAPRAAAVLNAADPAAALREHEQSFGRSTLKPVDKISPDTAQRLDANAELMDALGISGTPAVLYKDKKGVLRMSTGLPQPDQIDTIFGP